MSDISINLVFEDELSGAVLQKILTQIALPKYVVGGKYNTGGIGRIRQKMKGLNESAKGMPYLVLVDLDRKSCPPDLLRELLDVPRHHNLMLRVAVRQVESWLLGCRSDIANYLAVRRDQIPEQVDKIPNAKGFLIELACKSRKKDIRADIVPAKGSTAKVGPDYNGCLINFVLKSWDPYVARKSSESLDRALRAIENFKI